VKGLPRSVTESKVMSTLIRFSMVLWFQPNYYSVSAPQKQAGEPAKAVRFTASLRSKDRLFAQQRPPFAQQRPPFSILNESRDGRSRTRNRKKQLVLSVGKGLGPFYRVVFTREPKEFFRPRPLGNTFCFFRRFYRKRHRIVPLPSQIKKEQASAQEVAKP
jgi:hypothetical protein